MKIATIKNVQKLFDVDSMPSKSKAARMISLCRDALDKNPPKILLIEDFKNYFGI